MKSRSRRSLIQRILYTPRIVRDNIGRVVKGKKSFDSRIEDRAKKGKPQLFKTLRKAVDELIKI